MEQEFVKSELYSHLSQGISFPKGQILLAAAIALKKQKNKKTKFAQVFSCYSK